jgi:hypothetical protein
VVCLTTFSVIEIPTNESWADLGIIKRKYADRKRHGLFKAPLQNLPREAEKSAETLARKPRLEGEIRNYRFQHVIGFKISIPGISLENRTFPSVRFSTQSVTYTHKQKIRQILIRRKSVYWLSLITERNTPLGKHNEHLPSNEVYSNETME